MEIEEYVDFCFFVCPYHTLKKIDPIHWEKMEPYLNCPVASYMEFVENVDKDSKVSRKIKEVE